MDFLLWDVFRTIFTAAPKVVRYICRPNLRDQQHYYYYPNRSDDHWKLPETPPPTCLHQLSNGYTVSQESFKPIIKEGMT